MTNKIFIFLGLNALVKNSITLFALFQHSRRNNAACAVDFWIYLSALKDIIFARRKLFLSFSHNKREMSRLDFLGLCSAASHNKLNFSEGVFLTCFFEIFFSIFAKPRFEFDNHKIQLKYGSEEMGSWFYKCSILLGFIMSKNLRGLWFYLLIKVQNATSLVFLTL